MVSTRSMRSHGTENGKQTGEVVDSFVSRNSVASSAKAPAEKGHKEVKKGLHKVLKESNAAEAIPADTVTKKAPVQKTARQPKNATIKEVEHVEELEAADVDDLHNAASIPLPEDDVDEPPPPERLKISPRKARSQVPHPSTQMKTMESACGAVTLSDMQQAVAQSSRQQAPVVPWKWILLILALAAGTALAVNYRQVWQPHLTESFKEMEGHFRTQARDIEAYVRGPLLLKATTWQGIMQKQVQSQRNRLAEVTLRARYGVHNLWRQAQKMIKPEEKMEDTKGCAAQLDAGALVAIVSHKRVYEGLRASLEDIWLGNKEDPHKGAGVLLVGSSEAANTAAALALEKALPSSCRSCILNFKAGQASHGHADAPGAVQKLLAGFLQRCPQGVVVVEDTQKLHPRLLPVFINALSEHGHFEVDGKAVPSWGALYVATMLDSDGEALSQPDEEAFKKEAKRALTAQLLAHPSAEQVPGYKAHTDAFRRRLEYVAPLQH